MKKSICIWSIFLLSFQFAMMVHANNADIIVYITDKGEKYHAAGCSYLHSINEITLKDAVNSGKTPCSRCKPPHLDGHYVGSTDPYAESEYVEKYSVIDKIEEPKKEYWAPGSARAVYLDVNTFHLEGCPEMDDSAVKRSLQYMDKEKDPCNYCEPLTHKSIEEIPGYKKDQILNFISDHFLHIFAGILTIIALIQFGKYIKERKGDTEEAEEAGIMEDLEPVKTSRAPGKAKPITEKEYYYILYAHKKPEELVKIPNGTFLVDGLPATDHRHKYGLYSVYISPKGTRYHRRKKCVSAPSPASTWAAAISGSRRARGRSA